MCVVTMKMLTGRGLVPDQLKVKAHVSFGEVSRGAELDSIRVNVTASGSALAADTFRQIVEDARVHCPICRLLEQRVSIEATLEPELLEAKV
jgi:organic hydroperoxide reductase OsmC/OhrA